MLERGADESGQGQCAASAAKCLSTTDNPRIERKRAQWQAERDKTNKAIKITNQPAHVLARIQESSTQRNGISCHWRAIGDHSYRILALAMPDVALAMLGQQHRQVPARETPARHQMLPAVLAMLVHQSLRRHRSLEVQATHAHHLDRKPHQGPASDARRAASSGSTRQAPRLRTSGGWVHGTDRRIVHWDRRDMVGWGRGVEVVEQRMDLGRAPRWSWPRWRVHTRASCDERRRYRCPNRPCGVSAGERLRRVR